MIARLDVESIYRSEADRLFRSIRAFANGNDDVASDVVAEAFAQLIRRGDEVRDPRAWLWTASFRIARGELRSRSATQPLTAGCEGSRPMDVGLFDVSDALRLLSPAQRAAVLLQDYAGFTSAEAARIYDASATAMRVHLMRARRRLAEVL